MVFKYINVWLLAILVSFGVSSCSDASKKETDSGMNKDLLTDIKNKDDQPKQENLFPFEEGIIHYRYTGSYDGTQIVYFKDSGRVFRVEEDYFNKVSPVNDRVHQVYINTPERTVYINLETKLGYEILKADNISLKDNLLKTITEVGLDSAMTGQGYSHSGEREVAGKQCRIYESKEGESQFCFWNNINIKTEMTLGEKFKYTLEATKIEDNVKVPDDKFEIEKDVRIMPYKEYVKKVYKF
jgi:hypothetical protein